MKEMINVIFEAGESTYNPGVSCNFMYAKVEGEVEDIELLAEVLIDDEIEARFRTDAEDPESFDMNAFDEYSYPILKEEILRQAKEAGIDENDLKFHWN